MELFVLFLTSLILDVLGDRGLVAMLTHRVDEVTVRPELSTPKLMLHVRSAAEDLFRGNALHGTDNLCRAVGRDGLNEEVDMVFVSAYFKKCEFKTF